MGSYPLLDINMGLLRFTRSYRLIDFFFLDYGSLPYSLALFLWSGVTFPLVALDKKYLKS